MRFWCLSVSPVSAETLLSYLGEVGKNYLLVAKFLDKVCAKNYKIRTMVAQVTDENVEDPLF